MKFENAEVWGFEHAIRGMRNPMNSWDKSDSFYCSDAMCQECPLNDESGCYYDWKSYVIGENDMNLARKLVKSGSEHRKFLRQIFVSVDITAPLYWWKEFDTYKVGTAANSTSTMHKLATTPITIDCFETDDYKPDTMVEQTLVYHESVNIMASCLIQSLEKLRTKYLETKDKKYWKELIRWLPESWLQTRTITMNYENLLSIVHQRKNHKLNEWSGIENDTKLNFISWVKTLPYAQELIFVDELEE